MGRDPHCQVHVDSPLLSRRHARIEVGAGRATVEDLGSKNGTQLNGSALDAVVELREGDEVRAGSAVLSFHWLASSRLAETVSASRLRRSSTRRAG